MTPEEDKTVGKVGFIGTSPSSRHLAPFDKPDWEIWGMGPAHEDEDKPTMPGFPCMKWDRWFELHPMGENDPEYGNVVNPGYWEWLSKQAKPVYYRPPLYKDLPGREFPWDEILERHGGFFLDSTVAWMMAFAYDHFPGLTDIGLWGIDFAATEERQSQKGGCYHFIRLFKLKGVKVHIPTESDMLYEPPPYPESDPLVGKLCAMKTYLNNQAIQAERTMADLKEAQKQQELQLARISGAMEQVDYFYGNRTEAVRG